jgi:hypothetical protein
MNPDKVSRDRLGRLENLPNIGPAGARDLRRLDILVPADLIGQDPYAMYERLCLLTGTRQDPCVLDVFLSVVRFMAGEPARPWWAYTEERQRGQAAAAPDRLKRPRQPMPGFVRQALVDRGLMADYEVRPAYQRNDYLGWIGRARRPDTQARRLAQMLDELERGGVYMGMAHPASRKG